MKSYWLSFAPGSIGCGRVNIGCNVFNFFFRESSTPGGHGILSICHLVLDSLFIEASIKILRKGFFFEGLLGLKDVLPSRMTGSAVTLEDNLAIGNVGSVGWVCWEKCQRDSYDAYQLAKVLLLVHHFVHEVLLHVHYSRLSIDRELIFLIFSCRNGDFRMVESHLRLGRNIS